jgi:hypothetical protein
MPDLIGEVKTEDKERIKMKIAVLDPETRRFVTLATASVLRVEPSGASIRLGLIGLSSIDAAGVRYLLANNEFRIWRCRGLFRARQCYVTYFLGGDAVFIELTARRGFFR